MPVLDEIELTRCIRASTLNKSGTIVILTGLNDANTMHKAFRAGATCFMANLFTRDRSKGLYAAKLGCPSKKESNAHGRGAAKSTSH
jgi:CheY-like chemotaxis protein